MQDIIIRYQDLSQYHAGQHVDRSAHCVRDLAGDWWAVIGTHDRSTLDGWQYEVIRCDDLADADRECMDRLVISGDRTKTVDLSRVRQAKKVLGRYLTITATLDPETLRCKWTVGEYHGDCDAADLAAKMESAIRAEAESIEVGRESDRGFESDAAATRRVRDAALAALTD